MTRFGGAFLLGAGVTAAAIAFGSRPLGVAGVGLLLAAAAAKVWVGLVRERPTVSYVAEPETAVATSIRPSSSTHSTSPMLVSSVCASWRCSSLVQPFITAAVIPRPTAAGVFGIERTIAVGHSGGAAITANILGTHPDLIDAALLVSCPCDVERWRAHMLSTTKFTGFQGKIATLSPITVVGGIPPDTRVTMLVGADDDVTPPPISQAYRDAAVRAGKRVALQVLPGEGHEILLIPAVLAALDSLVR